MKKIIVRLAVLMVGLFLLTGCSTEEVTPSFILRELAAVQWDDEETPVNYTVNPKEARDQIYIYKNEMISPTVFGQSEESFSLDKATVTDDEITIEYDGKIETFERLSSSVVQNEDRIQYEYFELP